jgi:hypothetical protein
MSRVRDRSSSSRHRSRPQVCLGLRLLLSADRESRECQRSTANVGRVSCERQTARRRTWRGGRRATNAVAMRSAADVPGRRPKTNAPARPPEREYRLLFG